MRGTVNAPGHAHDNKAALDRVTDENIGNLEQITNEFIENVTNITNLINEGGIGDVKGPEGAAKGNLAAFDNADGKGIEDSGLKTSDVRELVDMRDDIQQLINSGGGNGGNGDVTGPEQSTDGEMALFDGVTGKKIKGGGVDVHIGSMITGNVGAERPVMSFVKGNGFCIGGAYTKDTEETQALIYVTKGCVKIGAGMGASTYEEAIEIGVNAKVTNGGAVQIGPGSNGTANSFKFRDYTVVAGGDGQHYLEDVGPTSELKTSAKTVVAAINELKTALESFRNGEEIGY